MNFRGLTMRLKVTVALIWLVILLADIGISEKLPSGGVGILISLVISFGLGMIGLIVEELVTGPHRARQRRKEREAYRASFERYL